MDSLKKVREVLENVIKFEYSSIDEFCMINKISKTTIYNFLHNKKDFQISTLEKIATAIDRKLVVNFTQANLHINKSARSNIKLLLIDDDYSLLQFAGNELKEMGYEVHMAFNAVNGIESAKIVQPDLILLDLKMPGLGGKETCEILKGNTELSHIPVLAVSASEVPTSLIESNKFIGFYKKPIRFDELDKIIRGKLMKLAK